MTAEAAPNDVIGGFTIHKTLGRGAMGTVYEASDDGGARVALKVMHPHLDADPTARERLKREVMALQRLRHPAVARVLDFELDADAAFVVTELIDGRTLEAEIDEGGPLDTIDLAELASQLAGALEAIHLSGVVHRDLKPSNVMISERGPVLIDFGIAQSHDADADPGLTQHGFVIGTPGYIAPELLDGASATPNSDWWSWAALLAFAGTGRAPFGVRPVDVVLRRSREGRADLVGLPARTARALAAALQAEVPVRWPHAMVVRALGREADAATFAAEAAEAAGVAGAAGIAETTKLPTDDADASEPGEPGGPNSPDEPTEPTGLLPAPQEPTTWIPPGVPPTAMLSTATGPIPMGEIRYQDFDAVAASTEAEPEELAQAEASKPALVRPKLPRRIATILVCLAPLTVLSATRPGLAVIILSGLIVGCRIAGHSWQAVWDRREKAGTIRRSDVPVTIAKAPLHVLLGAVTALPQLLVAALAGFGVWFGGRHFFLESAADGTAEAVGAASTSAPGLGYCIVIAVAFAVMAFVAWFGPASKTTRIGARRILLDVVPGPVLTALVVAACLIGSWVLARPLIGDAPEIHWSPLPNPIESIADVESGVEGEEEGTQ